MCVHMWSFDFMPTLTINQQINAIRGARSCTHTIDNETQHGTARHSTAQERCKPSLKNRKQIDENFRIGFVSCRPRANLIRVLKHTATPHQRADISD
jgi:hypothetical protein